MDRVGFELIDAQYQQELETARQRITDELTIKFHGKIYSASNELNKEGREREQEKLQYEIAEAIQIEAKRIGAAHFPDFGGREEALLAMQQEEARQAQVEKVKAMYNRNSQGFNKEQER